MQAASNWHWQSWQTGAAYSGMLGPQVSPPHIPHLLFIFVFLLAVFTYVLKIFADVSNSDTVVF